MHQEWKMDNEMLPALALAPFVAVARADGAVSVKERHRVLSWAVDVGLSEGQPAYRVVERWLAESRSAELLEIWRTHYVSRLSLALTREAKCELRRAIIDRAQALLEEAGAFAETGQAASARETAVIEEIDDALA
jgi:hypothetical protein